MSLECVGMVGDCIGENKIPDTDGEMGEVDIVEDNMGIVRKHNDVSETKENERNAHF